MFDKRLFALIPEVRNYIVASVALRWVGLVATIALFVLVGSFLQELLVSPAAAAQGSFVVACAAVAVVIRMVCTDWSQKQGLAAAAVAKQVVRQRMYDKLVRLGPAYSERVATAEAVQLSAEGAEQLESYFGLYLPQLFYAVLAPVTLFACLAPLCAPAAGVLLACVPLIPLSIMGVQKFAKRAMRNYWGAYTDLGGAFLDNLQGLTTLKIYQADGIRHQAMNREAERFRKATMSLLSMQLNSITVMDLLAYGGAAAGIVVVLAQHSAGMVTFGGAFSLVFLSAEFFLPMRLLGSFFHTAMNGMAAAEKIFAILDAPEPRSGARVVDYRRVDVVCRGVSYSYDGERKVLSNIDFVAPTRGLTGIVGESGSGKTTLAGVLSGRINGYDGCVEVGGVDARALSFASLMETVTTVPSRSYLFKGTVRENLQLANPHASDEELWSALATCRLDVFVQEAGGLEAAVAEQGANLSGGQCQRLAVARALLHDAPLYIFDEATSNVDTESERAIFDAIAELAKRASVIVISHRLAAVRHADRIYALDAGGLAEAGSHEELMKAGGVYARLWNKQAELESYASNLQASCVEEALTHTAESHLRVGSAPSSAYPAATISLRKRSHVSVMFGMLRLARPLVPWMILAITLGVLGFGAAIFLTVFAAYALLDQSGMPQVVTGSVAVVALVCCGLLRGPLRYGEQMCNHYLAFKLLALVRDRVFGALRRLAPAKLEGRAKGDLVSLVTSDIELMEVFYAHTVSPIAIAALVSVGMVAFIGFVSPVLGALALVAYAVVGVGVPLVASRAAGTDGRALREGMGLLNTFVLDSLRGLGETLQYGRSAERSRELAHNMTQLSEVEKRLKGKAALFGALTSALVVFFDLVMVGAAAALYTTGLIDFGGAVVAISAFMSSFGPLIAVADLGSSLQQTLASGARVLDLLEEQPQTQDVSDGENVEGFTGAMMRRVDFSYGGSRVLERVNMCIQPGSIVHLAGPSGSGKSTLLRLLMRFWDVERGVVELGGADIRRINTTSLRASQSYMTQDTHLFSGTIEENIRLAKPSATPDEVAEACRKAALFRFVEHLPHGLDTQLGELGEGLSGGERQRLGLARAFLHDAPLMLLDEPTSNLDALNEAEVLRTLEQHRGNSTIVLVSHRVSTAAVADEVYTVADGRVSKETSQR